MNTLSENSKHPDLTKVDKSVGNSIEGLISSMNNLTLEKLKEAFLQIIEDPNTNISQVKINKYKMDLARIYDKYRMQKFITNIYLKSANLGL